MTKLSFIHIIIITLLETPHVVVAAAIAYKIGNPAFALPIALGSHFILDMVPHWNPHLNTELKKFGKLSSFTRKIIIADSVLALFLGLFIASLVLPDYNYALTILAAGFLGAFPDLVEAPYFLFNRKNPFLEKFVKFQKSLQNDTSIVPGLLAQFATIVAAFLWIFN